MKLTETRNPFIYTIRRFDAQGVQVNDRWLHKSCLISFEQIVDDWPVTHLNQVTDHLSAIENFAPEVLILGTGTHQLFPSVAQMQQLSQLGCGIEFMSNASAIRTYSVLTTEERRVMLGLIFEEV
jgi:uncharacterized protein